MKSRQISPIGVRAQVMRERLARGETVFGVFCKGTSPEWIECLGRAGFDFCILDREHGPVSYETLQNLIAAADVTGVLPIVRVGDAGEIGHALDLGAGGVEVPQVASAKEARAIVAAAKFSPLGERGVCRFVRAADYSALPRAAYFNQANETLVILQLENTQLAAYRKMAELPGVDVLFIGPYDLSQQMGLSGQIDHPKVIAEIRKLIALARRRGKAVGIFADTPEQAARWVAAGCQYIAYSVDVGIFFSAAAELAAALRKLPLTRGSSI